MITGAFGGFGKEILNWMTSQGAQNLVLVGRRGAATDDSQRLVKELGESGANVLPIAADITKNEEVQKLIQTIKKSMPKLKGIIHAAAVLDDGMLIDLNDEKFEKVIKPKILGSWYLHLLTQDMPLDFFLLFSSMASLIGNQRQANYVAGNIFLDNLAYYRRQKGLPATTINWGAIGVKGMTDDIMVTEHLKGMGVTELSTNQTLDALGKVISWNPIQLGVMNIDWEKIRDFDPVSTAAPILSYLIPKAEQDSGKMKSLHNNLISINPEDRKEMLSFILAELIAETLQLPSEVINLDTPIIGMGIDSLMASELGIKIQTELGAKIPTLELLKGISIDQLAEQLILKMGIESDHIAMASSQEMDVEKTPKELLKNIDSLSEDEIDKILIKALTI